MWVYVPFWLLVVVATSNAVNDRFDGLAIGPVINAGTYSIHVPPARRSRASLASGPS
jgi:UDP-N-acetylmuramyl pentapeptide phosphotransferase/UDP-N-acetylglucosamine-1-phosphate transferase